MRKGPTLGSGTLYHFSWLGDGTDQPGGTRATVQSSRSKAGDTQSHPVPQNHQVVSLGLSVLRFVLPHMWGYPTSGHHCAFLCPMGKGQHKDPWPWDPPFWPKTYKMAAPSSAVPPQTSPSHPAHTHPPTGQLPGKCQCPQTAGATAGLDAQGTKLPSPGLLAAEGLAASASTARCLPGTASPGTCPW